MIVTDLDGTLLNSNYILSKENNRTLMLLKKKNIIRVVATGRVLYSARKVLSSDFPIDYLIFSSGAGILDYKTGKLLRKESLNVDEVKSALQEIKKRNLNYMIHAPVPENHYSIFSDDPKVQNQDFLERLNNYREFATPYSKNKSNISSSSIIVSCILAKEGEAIYQSLKTALPYLKVIRCTSPLNDKFNWIEIISKNTSKAVAAHWLKDYLKTNSKVMVVGNDYNDLDMLKWADYSYVVGNAPKVLKEEYRVVSSNDHDGFTEAVNMYLNLINIQN